MYLIRKDDMLSKIKNFILDTLFPISCLSCGKHGAWLCDSCLEKIPLRIEQACPVCEKLITPDGRVCSNCWEESPLNGLLAASYYETEIKSEQPRQYQFIASFQERGLVSQIVHYYKYRFVRDLRVPLGKVILKSLFNSQLPLPDFIIPVPLHKRRLRRRGFNQAELLADYLSDNLTPGFKIPVLNNFLIRQKHTRPQMEIKNYKKRKNNIQNAFSVNNQIETTAGCIHCDRNKYSLLKPESILKNKIILLVDDIATTGSTLFECAKTLKQNGAKEVYAVVVARQEYGKK